MVNEKILVENYNTLDIMKFLCAIAILMYHWGSEWACLPSVIEPILSLYAVILPVFMSISGFLFSKKLNMTGSNEHKSVFNNTIKRSLSLYLIWSIGYIVYQIIYWKINTADCAKILISVVGWFTYSTFYTIWFIPAQIIGIGVVYYMNKKIGKKYTLFFTIALYLIGAFGLTYSFIVKRNDGINSILEWYNLLFKSTRNGLFYAPIFVMIGCCLADVKVYLKLWQSFLGIIVSMSILLIEAVLLKVNQGNTGIDMALFLPIVIYFIMNFVLAIDISEMKTTTAIFMRRISILIFLSQRYFLTVIPNLCGTRIIEVLEKNNVVSFLFVVGGTVITSTLILILSYRVKILKKLY